MTTHPAPGHGAAARIAVSGPAAARRRPSSPTPTERLEQLSDRLDQLIYDVSLGTRSHRQHEANVEAAESIATELRSVFRSPTPAKAEHPPLWQQGGRAAW